MKTLKTLLIIASLGAIGYGIYLVEKSKNDDSLTSPVGTAVFKQELSRKDKIKNDPNFQKAIDLQADQLAFEEEKKEVIAKFEKQEADEKAEYEAKVKKTKEEKAEEMYRVNGALERIRGEMLQLNSTTTPQSL